MTYPTRVKIALAMLLALGLVPAGVALYEGVGAARRPHQGEVEFYEEKLAPVRPFLPRDAFVDYVSDVTLNGEEYLRGYYNARYVLPEVRLAWKRDCEYAVGLFGDPRNIAPMSRQRGYAVERHFDNDVVLLKRQAPKRGDASLGNWGRFPLGMASPGIGRLSVREASPISVEGSVPNL